jgi:hypothetical protein
MWRRGQDAVGRCCSLFLVVAVVVVVEEEGDRALQPW